MLPQILPTTSNKSALRFMLITVLVSSAFPFVFALGNASAAPFLFNALMNFSAVIAGLFFLTWFHRTKRQNQTSRETLAVIYSKFFTPEFFWMSVARFQHIFFAMSLAYINVAIASVLAAIKPLVVVFFLSLLFKKSARYQKITLSKSLLFVLAFIGAALVVASQSESFGSIARDLLNRNTVIGTLLVLFSALVGGMGVPYSLKLGAAASEKKGKADELFFTMAILVFVWFVTSALFLIFGLTSNETFADIDITPPIVFGFFGMGLSAILSRAANFKTTNLGINALRYLTPILTLIWLGFASLIDVPHLDWLVIGSAVIIAANLLLNFKPTNRIAHNAHET